VPAPTLGADSILHTRDTFTFTFTFDVGLATTDVSSLTISAN